MSDQLVPESLDICQWTVPVTAGAERATSLPVVAAWFQTLLARTDTSKSLLVTVPREFVATTEYLPLSALLTPVSVRVLVVAPEMMPPLARFAPFLRHCRVGTGSPETVTPR